MNYGTDSSTISPDAAPNHSKTHKIFANLSSRSFTIHPAFQNVSRFSFPFDFKELLNLHFTTKT
jgi:hypothetical protein